MGMKNIRTVRKEDIERIAEIVQSAENFNPGERETAIELIKESLAGDDDYIVFVLEEEDKVHGYVCYGPTPLTEGTYDLYWIAVDSESQGKGYGRALLQFVEEDLRKRKARLLVIETSSMETYGNTVRFYEKAGYQLASVIKEFYKPGDDKLTFIKYLR
jgi:ribosomal protein S18 acetylase RimI-like enzyme